MLSRLFASRSRSFQKFARAFLSVAVITGYLTSQLVDCWMIEGTPQPVQIDRLVWFPQTFQDSPLTAHACSIKYR